MARILVHPGPGHQRPIRAKTVPRSGRPRCCQTPRPSWQGSSPLPLSPSRFLLNRPILLYGSDLFTPLLKMQDGLDTFWRRVQRWSTNCFSSTPIPILAIESCLPPLPLPIEHGQRMAALRLTSSPPEINPAAARLHKSVPNWSFFRSPQYHQSLLVKLNPAKRPFMWKTPRRNIRQHLPIDEISHQVLPCHEQ